ncbi:DEAD/DEAH box helicase, partial [Micrococcus sp. KRD128]|uniref:DEAD/DEAH box helicase n=1 Tax=Micrococcus sp. KRD128 TaxID=2729722 RepID=UPI0019CFCB05
MAHHPASATPHDEPELSPAERYARARAARHHAGSELGRFAARVGFPLDDFQRRACAEVEDGHGVLVAAPTGAGKTVVGEFAVHLALARGTKAFYTTPIKALSNQKHADLARVHGAENVGLLTGDTSVNPDAPVVVMTTEVLRNMLYAQSDTLIDLGFVVMDEVHYLADRFRGPVWEEVIIHLPEHVQLISLSATVSNAEEFGAWLDTVRGATTVIVSEHRPVPLWQHVMAGGRLYDLFAEDIAFEDTADRDGEALLNPELKRLGEEAERRFQRADWGRPGRQQHRDGRGGGTKVEDLEILGFWAWRDGLSRGFAAHHAGMLPPFKEAVEDLFAAGALKAVFATETLALGINMPARSVVIEKLVKFNGENHVDITPGEYTQLTGRAGRRGIDVEGHAVVMWRPGLDPAAV